MSLLNYMRYLRQDVAAKRGTSVCIIHRLIERMTEVMSHSVKWAFGSGLKRCDVHTFKKN